MEVLEEGRRSRAGGGGQEEWSRGEEQRGCNAGNSSYLRQSNNLYYHFV